MTAMSAMIPLPPGLFSTTIDWPRICDMAAAIVRALLSAPPPGAEGTMMRIGRVG